VDSGCTDGIWAGLSGDLDIIDRTLRLRNLFADLAHGIEVESQSVLEVPPRFFLSVAHSNASEHIR